MSYAMIRISVLLTVAASTLAAASPVARLLSSAPVTISGARTSPAAVPSWPIALGDEIVTTSSRALVYFNDGTRIELGAGSRMSLEESGSELRARLIDGMMDYELASNGKVKVYPGVDARAAVEGDAGQVQVDQGTFVYIPRGKSRPSFTVTGNGSQAPPPGAQPAMSAAGCDTSDKTVLPPRTPCNDAGVPAPARAE